MLPGRRAERPALHTGRLTRQAVPDGRRQRSLAPARGVRAGRIEGAMRAGKADEEVPRKIAWDALQPLHRAAADVGVRVRGGGQHGIPAVEGPAFARAPAVVAVELLVEAALLYLK